MKKVFILFGLCLTILFSCKEDYTPKPNGYFRIDLPQAQYFDFDTTYPFSFKYSQQAHIEPDIREGAEKYWLDIYYPDYKARIHLSYKEVDENLGIYFEDARVFVNKHIPKASNINEIPLINKPQEVYGLIFDIRGTGAASPYQFYLTDSTNHFVRGALYFNTKPNNDSLRPIIDFIVADIYELIDGLEWKDI